MIRFNVGDEVLYDDRHVATIVDVYPDLLNSLNTQYLIQFKERSLIPPQMKVREASLKLHGHSITIPCCPLCGEEWTITRFNMEAWEDCINCGKSREQIEKEIEESLNEESVPDLDEFI